MTRLLPETAAPITQPGATAKMVLTVDSRTNSLFVRSDNPSALRRIRALATDLDTPAAAGGNIHVIYLRNAEATKVAETRALLSGQPTASTTPQTAQQSFAPTQQAAPGGPGATNVPSFAPSTTSSAAPSSSIQAYPSTNSLVIVAAETIYNSLRSVIDKLDARRAQVFVEALIVEVSSTKAAEFGIQWQDLSGLSRGGSNVIGGTNFAPPAALTNITNAASNIGGVAPGLNIGVVKAGGITINGVQVLNLGFLARALENDTAANILSTPNLLTLDNEEAKIIVGQNVPFITGSFAQTGTTGAAGTSVNPFQTIERKDVGLTLKVKPQVAEGGSVKLQIFQEVSNVTNDARTVGSADVITNKRSIESTVLVDDGQIIVLGGLVQDDAQANKSAVPVLGRIPILGNLFRSETRNRTKTNLMVFLRPYVLRDEKAGVHLTEDRYDYIRNQRINAHPDPHQILPSFEGPQLPQVGNQAQPNLTPFQPAPAPAIAPFRLETPPADYTPPAANPPEKK
jgi:general secretion pathway protein D